MKQASRKKCLQANTLYVGLLPTFVICFYFFAIEFLPLSSTNIRFFPFFPSSFLCCMVPIPLLFSFCMFQEFVFLFRFSISHYLLLLVFGQGFLFFLRF